MRELQYKDRSIVNFTHFDELARCWVPMVEIRWRTERRQDSHTISGPLRGFEKWQDAETFMTEMAKEWIDNHPRQAMVLKPAS